MYWDDMMLKMKRTTDMLPHLVIWQWTVSEGGQLPHIFILWHHHCKGQQIILVFILIIKLLCITWKVCLGVAENYIRTLQFPWELEQFSLFQLIVLVFTAPRQLYCSGSVSLFISVVFKCCKNQEKKIRKKLWYTTYPEPNDRQTKLALAS